MDVSFVSLEGHKRTFTFQNADVSIPILSTGLLTDVDHTAMFEKTGGDLYNTPTGENIRFFRMYGVYFFKFRIDQRIPIPPLPTTTNDHDRPQRFQAGAAA